MSKNSTRFVAAAFVTAICGLVMSSPVSAAPLVPSQDANLTNDGGSEANTPSPGGNQEGGFLTVNWQAGWPNYGLIQFDLSAYAGDTITSATLDLYQAFNNSAPTSEFSIFANTAAWSQSTADYNNAPTYNPSPFATQNITGSSPQYDAFDVTSLVQDWVNGTFANDGVSFIRTDQPNPLLYFDAGTGTGHPPELFLEFSGSSSVPEPSSLPLLLAGLGMIGGAFYFGRKKAKSI